MHFLHYSLRIRISFKISFQCSLKLILIKKFHGTFFRVPWNLLNNTCGSMEFLGTWATKPQVPHGTPWKFVQIQSSMEFHGTFSIHPSSMEFHGTFNFPPKSSMEFHGTFLKFHGIPWNLINFIFKKIIFLNIVFGIWLMIRCYLAKISQKRYILHWFQYRNSYFEHHLNVSKNGARSAKMACCYIPLWFIAKYHNTCVSILFDMNIVVWLNLNTNRIDDHPWRLIIMCNKSTSAGTSLEGTPMFVHVTLHRTFNPQGSKCPWWQDVEAAS